MELKINWDFLGIATSIACAIHCALLPLILSSLPVFGINIIHNSFFEWGMIGLAFVVGSYSLVHSYIRHHRKLLPLLLFSSGFIFLVSKQFFPAFEYVFLCSAVCFILTAHFMNYKYCHLSKPCDSPHHNH
ncbi:MAG: MerC domain-containing protein [Chitinophagaceae bacterium]|nr:MerC domain-containing protein [Chitinophagaceae bacterium]